MDHALNHLQDQALQSLPRGSLIRLRIEKPRAIAFADAPAVEVIRQLNSNSGDTAGCVSANIGDSATPELRVIKPYLRR